MYKGLSMVSVVRLKPETDGRTGEARVYVRWDWETTLARLRPLLSTTGVLGEPVLPELWLLVRTRPGQDNRDLAQIHKTDSVSLPPRPWTGEVGATRQGGGGVLPTSDLICDDTLKSQYCTG